MIIRNSALLCLSLFLLWSPMARAGAFCVRQQGGQPQCFYDDAGECRRRAAEINGLCSVNKDVIQTFPTNGNYCLVTSDHAALCHYLDRVSCEAAATKQQAVCVDATPAGGSQPDPHREAPNRPY